VIEDRGSIGSDEQQRLRPTEDDKSGESQKVPQTTQRAASGRPPAYESRAAEFRRRFIVWKQTPESMRPSLRALAGELGTSHQILVYHLNRLDRWQAQERAKRIRAEGRPFTAALVEVGGRHTLAHQAGGPSRPAERAPGQDSKAVRQARILRGTGDLREVPANDTGRRAAGPGG